MTEKQKNEKEWKIKLEKQNKITKKFKNIKIKKIKNSDNNKIGILLGTIILLLLITFSLLRLLPIGKFLDEFIFSFLFGWSKYLIYILLYISLIPFCFNYYFKFKASFVWAIIATIICCVWTIETITIISRYDHIWFNNKFHINLINKYYQSWWNSTIFNNYHGFFKSPISFNNLTIDSFFPYYLVGGLIGNTILQFSGYTTFFVNFILNMLIIIIVFCWLFFNRPLIFFTTVSNHIKETILDFKFKKKEKKIIKLEKAKEKNKKLNLLKNNIIKINNLKRELKINKKSKLGDKQLTNENLENNKIEKEKINFNIEKFAQSLPKNKNINEINDKKLENNEIKSTKQNKINNQTEKQNNNQKKLKIFLPEQIIINQKYILPKLKSTKKSDNIIKKQEENEKYALENKEKINQLFREFSVKGKVNDFNVGATVTKYEVSIISGMKINKITNLEKELKLVLANNDIRIETPIAGKSMIGIEVSNKNIVPINMQEQFENISEKYKNQKLLISIGRNTTGDYIFHSLKEMPHLLIAGSTGSGKSVFINDLIISLLLQYKPNEIKLILIDPKWVELAIYNDIPHLIIPVINEAKETPAALQVVILEMIRRYKLFAKNANRDIESYNKKIIKEIDKLPYYIIVIDELADVMVQAKKEIEEGIMRITQMGRAAGIHLVIATQRPSVDVITGVIKNNIPSRIAFKVSSWIDSKTIIDTSGAEKLLGKGDMLFMSPGQNNINRLQSPWISDEDVSELINFIKEQSLVQYDNNFIEKMKEIKD